MRISIDISYYPLKEEFIPTILDFVNRLQSYKNIQVQVNGMSTQVFGEYNELMSIITQEIEKSMSIPYSVFILKIVNSDLQLHQTSNS